MMCLYFIMVYKRGLTLTPNTAFEADRRAVNITINSIGTELIRDDRRKLYSNFGLFYPYGHENLPSVRTLIRFVLLWKNTLLISLFLPSFHMKRARCLTRHSKRKRSRGIA